MTRPASEGSLGATLDLVATSLAVIRAGQAPSGALTAGPTFSQYGFSWFRDGSFIAEALSMVGEAEAADRFHHWVAHIVLASAQGIERARAAGRAGRVPDQEDYLHCRYSVDGEPSRDDGWFSFQLDGPGIWLWSLTRHLLYGGRLDAELRAAVVPAARYLADLWQLPCADAWEEHGDKVHTSTLAAIRAGLDAAVSLAPELADEPAVADARAGLAVWMSEGDGAYSKWVGSDEVDASLLWMAAPYETVLASEPRFAATLERIERDIVDTDGGVHRFTSDTFYGGGAWPVLTSAYGRVLLRRGEPGDLERAVAALRWIEAQADEHGHLPEQVPDHAFAPERIDEWREEWGESARPLLWSHATYLALRAELAERVDLDQPDA